MPIELVYDCGACPAGTPRQYAAVLSGFVPNPGAPDVNGPVTLTHYGPCGWSGFTAGGTEIFLDGGSSVGFVSVLKWVHGAELNIFSNIWSCNTLPRTYTRGEGGTPSYADAPFTVVLTPVETTVDPGGGGGGGGADGGGFVTDATGFPVARHHGSFLGRAADGKAVYGVRCAPAKVGGRHLATYAGRKDGKAYYGAAECGPMRVCSFLQRLPDGKALYAFADPCCNRRGSGSGSVAGSGSSPLGSVPRSGGSGSGSMSGLSGSGAGPGSVSGGLSGSGASGRPLLDIPCSGCFGAGTPHPDDGTPITVSVTFLDQGGVTFGTVNDGNHDYQQAVPQGGLNNLQNFSAHMCITFTPPLLNRPIVSLTFVDPGAFGLPPGIGEGVWLYIQSCRPFVAVGVSSYYGRIVVTGNY